MSGPACALACAIASRKLPAPLSLRLLTVNVDGGGPAAPTVKLCVLARRDVGAIARLARLDRARTGATGSQTAPLMPPVVQTEGVSEANMIGNVDGGAVALPLVRADRDQQLADGYAGRGRSEGDRLARLGDGERPRPAASPQGRWRRRTGSR